MVPATMSKSACLGEKRTTSAPKREVSYLLLATLINSMAQHAVPKTYGNNEDSLAQDRALSSVVVMALLPKIASAPTAMIKP